MSSCGSMKVPCKTLQHAIYNISNANDVLILDGGREEMPLRYYVPRSIKLTKSFTIKQNSRSSSKPIIIAEHIRYAWFQIKYAFFTENVTDINLSFTSINFIDVGIIIMKPSIYAQDTKMRFRGNITLTLNDCVCEMKRIYYYSDKAREDFIHNSVDDLSIFIEQSSFSHYSRDIINARASIASFGRVNYVQIKNTVSHGSLIILSAGFSRTTIKIHNVTIIDAKDTPIYCSNGCANVEITNSNFFNTSGHSVFYYHHDNITQYSNLLIENSSFIGITARTILNVWHINFFLTHMRMQKNSVKSRAIILLDGSFGLLENLKYTENKAGYEVFSVNFESHLNVTNSNFLNNEIKTLGEVSGGELHLVNVIVNNNKIATYGGIDHVAALFHSRENGILAMQNVIINGTQNSWFRQGNLVTVFEATINLTNVIFSNNIINTVIKSDWSNIYLKNILIKNSEAHGTPTSLDIYSSSLRSGYNISLNNVTVVAKGTEFNRKKPLQVVNAIDSTGNFIYKNVRINLEKNQTSYVGTTIKEKVNFASYMQVVCPVDFSAVFNNSIKKYFYPKIEYQMNCVKCVNISIQEFPSNFFRTNLSVSFDHCISLLVFAMLFHMNFLLINPF